MVITDASVVFKWFDQAEEYFDQALKILNKHLAEDNIVVPDLFFYELANAWTTKSALSPKDIKLNLVKLESYKLNIESFTYNLIQKAVVFSKKYKVSLYDASYAVLAKEKKCDLITADSKFVTQVNLFFVKDLGKYTEKKE